MEIQNWKFAVQHAQNQIRILQQSLNQMNQALDPNNPFSSPDFAVEKFRGVWSEVLGAVTAELQKLPDIAESGPPS